MDDLKLTCTKNFRGHLVEYLKNNNIPVQVSTKGKDRIGNEKEYIKKDGVSIERKKVRMYQASTHKQDTEEIVIIKTNGYIDKDKMEKIVEEMKKQYKPYLIDSTIKKVTIYVY